MLPPLPSQHDFLNDFGISDLEFNASGLVWSDLGRIYSDYESIRHDLSEHGQQFVKMMWNKDIPAVNSIKIRIKDPLHLIEKVIRKAIDRPQRQITQANYRGIITDLIGIRAIHKYKVEWIPILKAVQSIGEPVGMPIAYVREGDPVEDFKKMNCAVVARPSGYRSVHQLVAFQILSHSQPGIAEVQIRTIFEEGWGEIDHDLRYPKKAVFPDVERCLSVLNGIARSGDELALRIWDCAVRAHVNPSDSAREVRGGASRSYRVACPTERTHVCVLRTILDGKELFLVQDHPVHSQWGFMFPWLREKEHDSPVRSKDLEEKLSREFEQVQFRVEYSGGADLCNNLKFHAKNNYELTRFDFLFHIVTVVSGRTRFLGLVNRRVHGYRWKTLEQLMEDEDTVENNRDVVCHIQNCPQWKNADCLCPPEFKVIWNVTKACPFQCEFCGTDSGGVQSTRIDYARILKVFQQIDEVAGNLSLDLGGGDPLGDPEMTRVISLIRKSRTLNRIRITTTGVALQGLSDDTVREIADEYDISYDYPTTRAKPSHRHRDYNRLNLDAVERLITLGKRVNILTTLSSHNTDDATIMAMIEELRRRANGVSEIRLLRLMPVGRQSYDSYPKPNDYDPRRAITEFQTAFPNVVKLQCAFRAVMGFPKDECCMCFQRKIGIDHHGNVFACAWGGYLKIGAKKTNPFFLGNVFEKGSSLSRVLAASADRFRGMDTNNFCRVFSFLESPKDGFLVNHDKFGQQGPVES